MSEGQRERAPAVARQKSPPGLEEAVSEERYAFIDWGFFDLAEPPFSMSPDPRYFFLGRSQEWNISEVMYGIAQKRGFFMVTGEVGTGKTILSRTFTRQLDAAVHNSVILSSSLEGEELVYLDFRGPDLDDRKTGTVTDLESLERLLREDSAGRSSLVVIIDEAQNLSGDQLDQVRKLADPRRDGTGTIQFILVGQPELRERIRERRHQGLDAAIAVRSVLKPLTRDETGEYVRHRLNVAAEGPAPVLFTDNALRGIHHYSRGNPRMINLLCDSALLEAYKTKQRTIDLALIRTGSRGVGLGRALLRWPVAAAAAGIAAALLLWTFWQGREPSPPAATPSKSASSTPETASRVSSTPVVEVDGSGIVRVDDRSETLKGSLATLFRIWDMEFLAGESTSWKIVNFNASLLDYFFREMGIQSQYGIELHARWTDIGTILKVGIPCLFGYTAEGEGGSERYAVLAGYSGGKIVVFDPLDGRIETTPEAWKESLAGPVYYLFKGERGHTPLKVGNRGTDVMILQEELQQAGFFRGTVDGQFGDGTRQAVQALQKKFGLDTSGVADLETRLILQRASDRFVPTLEK